jgi:UDP-N-acetylmuramoyl-L-alanyl-D-glutamate--2,6-diaminopimelate ligase
VTMRLRELLATVEGLTVRLDDGELERQLTAVVHDTADVVPGALFCCVRGSRVDGHDLAPKAIDAGATALLVDHPLPVSPTIVQLVVADVRVAMAPVAAAFWRHPSRDLTVIGVTGTAGKTTVTHLVRAVLNAGGRPCGLIGTLSGERTTPESPELQALLAAERAEGHAAVAMEVSSHGLELHRIDGTRFAVAAFTNLSREHLDFHHTMDAYFAAKARLFTPAFTDRAVVCTDDGWGRQLLGLIERRSGIEAVPVSAADATDVQLSSTAARFTWRGQEVTLALPGRFNVVNALVAATAADAVGIDEPTIAAGLTAAEPVPGRFEPVVAGQPFTVLVDYSHKPDALEHALAAARELAAPDGRVVVVFGCGGDRDVTKRPLMGAVAAARADRLLVTSDNPRSEDPGAIIDQVVAGIPAGTPIEVEPDRRVAIGRAVRSAGPGDVVLIAGKGHEATQTIRDQVLPFDDRVVARAALVEAGWGPEGDPEGSAT